MAATITTAISTYGQPKTEPNADSIHFLDEDLTLVPASGIPEKFRKLSRFLPVIVLVPKSAVSDKTIQKKLGPNKSTTGFTGTSDVCLPPHAAKAGITNPSATDTFEFGGVKVCFSTMEIYRNERPVLVFGVLGIPGVHAYRWYRSGNGTYTGFSPRTLFHLVPR